MAVYTVHTPPQLAKDARADADRLAFVRDGFYWWAFLLAPLWMVRHRLWLMLAAYVLVSGVLETAMVALGASSTAVAIVALLILLLVGLEAGTLRRFGLRRRGWKNVATISSHDVEAAEWRFFDAWLRKSSDKRVISSPGLSTREDAAMTSMLRVASAPDVIGLFPEAGGSQ